MTASRSIRRQVVALTVPRAGADPLTVQAQLIAPGLYIHPTVGRNAQRPQDRWRLAHHRGRPLGAFPNREFARQGALLVAYAADWTLSYEELVRPGALDAYDVAVRLQYCGGTLLLASAACVT